MSDEKMIYTLGYNNFSFFEFRDKIKELDALIIDVRYNPSSYNPFWNKKYLQESFHTSYIHVPELGNKNYAHPDKEFDIVDIEAGSRVVREYLDLGMNCLLLCACEDFEKCHRYIIAQYIAEKENIQAIHL